MCGLAHFYYTKDVIALFKVAIDGPGGAGKSSISKLAAKKLGFVYIDTGAMYRTAALYCLRSGIDIKNEREKAEKAVSEISMDIILSDEGQRIFLNGEDVTDKIRTPEVSMGASDVSAIPFVREKLVDMQRKLAESKNVIMDGRDIGTCVLPDAEVKIFLTASSEVRAKRRFDELLEKGEIVTFEEVLNDIIVRDRNDETRAVSPLKKADDAVVLDTSNLSFEESQKAVIKIIEDKMKEGF